MIVKYDFISSCTLIRELGRMRNASPHTHYIEREGEANSFEKKNAQIRKNSAFGRRRPRTVAEEYEKDS